MKNRTLSFFLHGILIFVPWSPMATNRFGDITSVIYLPILAAFAFAYLTSRPKHNSFGHIYLPFVGYTLIINVFYIDSIGSALKLPATIALLYLSQYTVARLTSRGQLHFDTIGKYAIYYLLVVWAYLLIDANNGISYYTYVANEDVVGGIGGNVSKYSALLFSIVPILAYKPRLLVLALHLIGTTLTLRRSALISTGVFYLLFFAPVLFSKQKFADALVYVIAFSGVLGFSVFIMPAMSDSFNSEYVELVIQKLNARLTDITEGTGGGRLVFWGHAIEMYSSYDPLKALFGDPTALRPYLEYTFGLAIGAHSDLLDFLCNYGIVGVVLYLGVYIAQALFFLRWRFRYPREARSGLAILSAMFLFATLTGGYFYMLNLMYFVFIGYLVGKINQNEKRLHEISRN